MINLETDITCYAFLEKPDVRIAKKLLKEPKLLADECYFHLGLREIAFSYAFHIHSFIKQTRFTQPDIENCGKARSTAFITVVHAAVISLILATPKGGVMKAIYRVFWEYPMTILSDPSGWFHDIIRYF